MKQGQGSVETSNTRVGQGAINKSKTRYKGDALNKATNKHLTIINQNSSDTGQKQSSPLPDYDGYFFIMCF